MNPPEEDSLLQGLLERCLEKLEEGGDPSLEEICAGRPELLPPLRQLMEVVGTLPEGAGRDARIGRTLAGRYELRSRLGAGGMGLVYLARDAKLEREVAVKILDDLFGGDPERRERFRREARSLASLDNPHIVAVHDCELEASPPFLVMDRIEGFDLASFLQELREDHPLGRIPSEEAVIRAVERLSGAPSSEVDDLFRKPWPELVARIALQMCSALRAAHGAGVLHRDLKPSNFMLEPNGRSRLCDFGLARSQADPALTRSSTSLGTPLYMSPEQVQGKEMTQASDIFSLGATLYECFCLRPPFQGRGRGLETRILCDEPLPPHRIQPKLSRDLSALCLKALRKEPRQRYASVADLEADLQRFLRFEPVEARTPLLPGPLRLALGTWRRYRPPLPILAGGGALVLALLLFGSLVFGGRIAEAESRRRKEIRRLRAGIAPTLALGGTREERLGDPRRVEQIRRLDRLLALDPKDFEARFLRLAQLEEEGRETGPGFEELGRETGDFAALRRAFLLLRDRATHPEGPLKAQHRALHILRGLPSQGPGRTLGLRLRILAAIETGELHEVRVLSRRLETLQGRTAFSLWAEGLAGLSLGRHPREPLELFLESDRLCPGHLPTLHALARLHRSLGKLEEAEVWIRRALHLRPSHVNYHNLHALILRDQKRYGEAESAILSFPPEAEGHRRNALGALRIWQALDPAFADQRESLLLRAVEILEGFLAELPSSSSRVRRAAGNNLDLARVLREGEPASRILSILDLLLDQPFHPILLSNLGRELERTGASTLDEPLRRKLAALTLCQVLWLEPENPAKARELVTLLSLDYPARGLKVIRAHLTPETLLPRDRLLTESLLSRLSSEAHRSAWRRALAKAGLLEHP